MSTSTPAARRSPAIPSWDTEIGLALAHADAAPLGSDRADAAQPDPEQVEPGRLGIDGCARPVVIAGVDEVGRGALAGPVVVGAFAVRMGPDGPERALPEGVRDSKALTARRREALVGPLEEAAHAHALGWAGPEEIDAHGIVAALGLAAGRAIAAFGIDVDIVLMDGDADVITPALADAQSVPAVHLRVKADRDCMSVAAASVLAKVARDRHMVELDALAPDYGWAGNKGYGSAAHREALRTRGAHAQHRRSWHLGVPATDGAAPATGAAADGANVQETPGDSGVLWSDAGTQPRPRIPKEAQP